MPRAQIGPAEVTLHHEDVLTMFQDGIVDGEVRVAWIVLSDIFHFFVIAVLGLFKLQIAQHAWEDALETLCQFTTVCDKDACVPVELTAFHEHGGKLTLRLLCE